MVYSKFAKYITVGMIFITLLFTLLLDICFADTTNDNTQSYYYEKVVNAGKDTGYSKKNPIKKNDPNFGWQLGGFCVSGYTERKTDNDGKMVFLKTTGDTVILSFKLYQNINQLNGNKQLSINNDKNGYDESLGVEKQDFGKGTLIVEQVDYQNKKKDVHPYTNYLAATAKKGVDTEVQVCEEGDYTVALDYEIKNDKRVLFGKSILPSYTNYKMLFKFSVRNGNNMVYIFDSLTGNELTNKSVTDNGFKIDLAKSRFLNVNVKRSIIANGVEDVRLNEAARDGESYTEEGIYTITSVNPNTNDETVKKIYVGNDPKIVEFAETGFTDYSILEPEEPESTQDSEEDEEPEIIDYDEDKDDNEESIAVDDELEEEPVSDQDLSTILYQYICQPQVLSIIALIVGIVLLLLLIMVLFMNHRAKKFKNLNKEAAKEVERLKEEIKRISNKE